MNPVQSAIFKTNPVQPGSIPIDLIDSFVLTLLNFEKKAILFLSLSPLLLSSSLPPEHFRLDSTRFPLDWWIVSGLLQSKLSLVSFNQFSWGVSFPASEVRIVIERFNQRPVLAPTRILTLTWLGFLWFPFFLICAYFLNSKDVIFLDISMQESLEERLVVENQSVTGSLFLNGQNGAIFFLKNVIRSLAIKCIW